MLSSSDISTNVIYNGVNVDSTGKIQDTQSVVVIPSIPTPLPIYQTQKRQRTPNITSINPTDAKQSLNVLLEAMDEVYDNKKISPKVTVKKERKAKKAKKNPVIYDIKEPGDISWLCTPNGNIQVLFVGDYVDLPLIASYQYTSAKWSKTHKNKRCNGILRCTTVGCSYVAKPHCRKQHGGKIQASELCKGTCASEGMQVSLIHEECECTLRATRTKDGWLIKHTGIHNHALPPRIHLTEDEKKNLLNLESPVDISLVGNSPLQNPERFRVEKRRVQLMNQKSPSSTPVVPSSGTRVVNKLDGFAMNNIVNVPR